MIPSRQKETPSCTSSAERSRELLLVVDQRKAWEKGYEGAVGVGQTGVHPAQIRFFKPGILSLGRL